MIDRPVGDASQSFPAESNHKKRALLLRGGRGISI